MRSTGYRRQHRKIQSAVVQGIFQRGGSFSVGRAIRSEIPGLYRRHEQTFPISGNDHDHRPAEGIPQYNRAEKEVAAWEKIDRDSGWKTVRGHFYSAYSII